MTVNTNLSRVQYNGNGVTTAFAFANRVTAASQLKVTHTVIATGVSTVLILDDVGSDGYSVSGVPGSSVTVNTVAAPATGTRLTIEYSMPLTQTVDYVANDPFPAETHEGALDKLTIIAQQQSDAVTRSLKFPSTADVSLVAELPTTPVDQAVLIFSGTGGAVGNGPTVGDIADAEANAAVATAAASAASGSAVAAAASAVAAAAAVAGIDQGLNTTDSPEFADLELTGIGLIKGLLQQPHGGRLTLASGTPVTTTDQSAKTSVYYTPYLSNVLPLFDGTRVIPVIFAELTLALNTGDNLSGEIYDVFAFNDGGTLRIGTGPAWASATTRGTGGGTTELTGNLGFYRNANTITLRNNGSSYGIAAGLATLLGSVKCTANGQTEDSFANRYVSNGYNKLPRAMQVFEATDTWNYSTDTFRQANGSTANQFNFINSTEGHPVSARVTAMALNNTGTQRRTSVGVGLDTTSTASLGSRSHSQCTNAVQIPSWADYKGYAGLGYHYLAWLERGAGTADTQTWYGDIGNVNQSGMIGEIYG